jgi:hypothetical protein
MVCIIYMEKSESTIKKYKMCLRKMDKQNIEYEKSENIEEIIKKIKNIKNIKSERVCDNSVNIYLSSLLWFYSEKNIGDTECEKKIREEIKKIKEKREESYSKNELSKKEKDVYLEWEEIIKCYNLLYNERNKNMMSMKKCVTIGLYVLFPPRRVMDYSKMIVKENSEDLSDNENYYVMNPPLFIFNIFKTKNTCEKIFDVPEELKKLLNEYIKKYDLIGKSLLDISDNELSIKIKKIMKNLSGKNASVNTFRHSYISYMQKNGKINTTKQKKILASMMGHNHRTQQEIYVKYESNNSSSYSSSNSDNE